MLSSPVPRTIEYAAYRIEETVYHVGDKFGLHKCIPFGRGRYKVQSETVESPPLESHPIPMNMSGPGIFWTHRPMWIQPPATVEF